MYMNCKECRATCNNAGKQMVINGCDEFEPMDSYVIETELVDAFPKRIVVKEKGENGKEVRFIPAF